MEVSHTMKQRVKSVLQRLNLKVLLAPSTIGAVSLTALTYGFPIRFKSNTLDLIFIFVGSYFLHIAKALQLYKDMLYYSPAPLLENSI